MKPGLPGCRGLLMLAGLLGASGVALAAVGAHATDASDPAAWRAWQSASLVHLVHAAALLAIALAERLSRGFVWRLAGTLMVLGVAAFSGSVYRSILLDLDGAGPVAPLGGSTLILAWLLVAVAAWRERA